MFEFTDPDFINLMKDTKDSMESPLLHTLLIFIPVFVVSQKTKLVQKDDV